MSHSLEQISVELPVSSEKKQKLKNNFKKALAN